jgi:hypothetical protein
MNISEIAAQLKSALGEAEAAHDALEKAKAALAPLEAATIEKDEAVTRLMAEYQAATGMNTQGATTRGKEAAGVEYDPGRQSRTFAFR